MTAELASLIVERQEDRNDVLWYALMCCQDCDDRIIEHDQLTFRCRVCDCDQSHRGLNAYADEYLTDLGRALKEAGR
jgi:hypothetical protein